MTIPINYKEDTSSVEVKFFPNRDLQKLYHWVASSSRKVGFFDELLGEFGIKYAN